MSYFTEIYLELAPAYFLDMQNIEVQKTIILNFLVLAEEHAHFKKL